MKRTTLLFCLFISLFSSIGFGQDYAKLSPFEMIRWQDEKPEVLLEGTWYKSLSIDGQRVDKILEHAKEKHGWQWDERFCEDLVQLLTEMGQKPSTSVDLVLKNVSTGKTITKKKVLMTREKRQLIRRAEPRVRGTDKPPVRVKLKKKRHAKLSPFTAVKWANAEPHVEFEGKWFGVLMIANTPTVKILEHCRVAHPGKWQKRFAEDIVQILSEMNIDHNNKVDLVLKDLESGKDIKKRQVPMTAENRRAIMESKRDRQGRTANSPAPAKRIKREHKSGVPTDLKALVQRFATEIKTPMLSAKMVGEDLDQLESLFANEYSYAKLKGVDYEAALDAIRFAAKDGISLADFHIQLRKVIGLFGDGHARARGVYSILPRRCAPFGFAEVEGKVIAVDADGRLAHPSFPFVKSIEGQGIAKWIEAAAQTAVQGSPQLRRMDALRYLSFLDYVGQSLGHKSKSRMAVTFMNVQGKTKKEVISLVTRVVFPSFAFKRQSQILDDNIGYLRVASMRSNGEFLASLDAAMAKFKETKGLIIDVRDNGGGSRHALRRLLPYFLNEEASPHICNVGRYRIGEGDDPKKTEGFMDNRFLYPRASKTWNVTERSAIDKFAKSFQPQWQVPTGEFSDWHYMLVDAKTNPLTYRYKSPVIILTNGGCFSATDIFVGAFKGVPGVTLMGSKTGGGSGRSKQTTLAWSRIRVKLSTMASFRPNGQLYDGVGIAPDVVAKPTLKDWATQNDSVLEAAMKRLN